MGITVEIATANVPPELQKLAETWQAAVNASLKALDDRTLSTEHASIILDIGLHSAASVFAPGDLGAHDVIHTINRFSHALMAACAAFAEDKAAAEAPKQ